MRWVWPRSEVEQPVMMSKRKDRKKEALKEFGRAAVASCGFPSGPQSVFSITHLTSLIEVQQLSICGAT